MKSRSFSSAGQSATMSTTTISFAANSTAGAASPTMNTGPLLGRSAKTGATSQAKGMVLTV